MSSGDRSLPLMRKTFIEAALHLRHKAAIRRSLPLMRKTFIEAEGVAVEKAQAEKSLPLMRKTFIEAIILDKASGKVIQVSSAYAEDFH